MDLRGYKSAKERRIALEKEQKVILNHIGAFSFDERTESLSTCGIFTYSAAL